MRKHNGMRPQDIVILLKIISLGKNDWQFQDLSRSLYLSGSEISESLNRSQIAGLVDFNKKRVNKLAFMEFLEYGMQYVFPQAPGALVNGMPTAHSHPFMKKKFISNDDYVWPDFEGKLRGQSIEPLYNNQVKAIREDEKLYLLLALVDVIRVGKVREIKLAIKELRKMIIND